MDETSSGVSPVVAGLGELVDDLEFFHARSAMAWATEMQVLAQVPDLILRREQEYKARAKCRGLAATSQLAQREIHAEVAAALRLSEDQVARRVDQAYQLVHDFPDTLFDAHSGILSALHAQTIVVAGGDLQDPETRSEFEGYALDMARELTPAQLAAALDGLVDRLDPEGTQDRIRKAKADRGVRNATCSTGCPSW